MTRESLIVVSDQEENWLDLSGLSEAGVRGIRSRFADRTHHAFSDTLAAVGNCVKPVRLVGHSTTIDKATGEIVGTFYSADQPLGVLYRPCGNRRESECPPCSRRYARDTYAMINAGLVGGKTIPESVADNPLLFVTLTAPSFGHVHTAHRNGTRCLPDPGAGSVRTGGCCPA